MNKKQPEQYEFDQRLAATGTDTAAPDAVAHDLRRLAAERLAAHRQRRNRLHTPEDTTPVEPPAPHNPIAAAVFERYSQSPSYRAVLAEQAERAIQQATTAAEAAVAEAEVAARNAQAVAEAQKRLLAELQLWDAPQTFSPQTAQTFNSPHKFSPEPVPTPVQSAHQPSDHNDPWDWSSDSLPALPPAATPAPAISSTYEPVPANLVEFPRQIVAQRKARPRLADLPGFQFPEAPQLRIFEAEPEAEPVTEPEAPTPEASAFVATPTPAWADLCLDPEGLAADQPATHAPLLEDEIVIRESIRSANYQESFGEEPAIQAAPFGLRIMATSVDLMFLAFSLLFALSVTARIIHRLPTGWPAVLALAASVAILWPLYLYLFFSFSDQTPGMRFARIGFCCFNDEAPSRSAIRKRILTQLFAVAPLGIGVFAALVDGQGLGWHDRTSRMYPRTY